MRAVAVSALMLVSCAPGCRTADPILRAPVDHSTAARPFRDSIEPTTSTTAATVSTAPRVVRPRPTRDHRRHVSPQVAARSGDGCGGWRPLISQYPWPVDTACRILLCESNGDANARNRSGATGLLQVMGGSTDPAANVAQAFAMWSHRGFAPWVCR